MSREDEILARTSQKISQEDFTGAEQILLQAISDLPPNLDIYNCLMELYYRMGLFDKVAEYFKTTFELFPDLDLNSCFMVSDNLLKAGAVKECELILLLTQQKYPQHQIHIADRLLKLYLHPAIDPHLAYNFIKNNYNTLDISTELSIEIMRKLSDPALETEHQDIFFFIFNTSLGDIHRKKVLLSELLREIHDKSAVLAVFDRLNQIGITLEPAIYFTLSSYLIQLDAKDEAKKVLEQGIEKEPESGVLFKEALDLLQNSPESSHTIKKFNELSTR